MEYINKDVFLSYKESGGSAYTELYGLSTYPDMGSQPEAKEVSNMRDKNKRYINGLQDTGMLKFDFYYNSGATPSAAEGVETGAFKKLKSLDGKMLDWKLTFPDGSSYSWSGKPTSYITGGSVGDPIKFSLTTSVESDIEYAEPTTSGGGST